MMTSSSPPWPEAHTSGTPLSGGDNWPSADTIRMRPGRSVTSILPSGRNASDHGLTRPLAKLRTSRAPADDGNSVSSPRVPVAITRVAASRIAAVSAAVTSPRGVFIRVRLRCRSSRVALEVALDVALESFSWKRCKQETPGSRRDRHGHGHLDREHGQCDDEAQRQRTDRQRSGDGVGPAGRSNGCKAASKASRAGRPYHGLNPSSRGRITRDVEQPRNYGWQYCGVR